MIKLSNYTTVIPLKSSGEYLLYNTFTDTTACIQDEQGKIVGKKEWDQKDLTADKEIFQELCDLGFFVKEEVNEPGTVKKTLWNRRFDTKELDLSILPTYWCNLKCPYCYQESFNRSQVMTEETCDQMLSWIGSKLDEFRSRKLNINILGGEALGKMDLLETICSKLKHIAIVKNCDLNFNLTTNGTLLSSSNVMKLKSLGINNVKITIDGDETIHNLNRPFSNGKGSFQTIIKNIIDHSDKLNIILRCNFNQSNLSSIPKLLDFLVLKKLNDRLEYVEFQPVMHKGCSQGRDNGQNCDRSVFTNQQMSQLLWLNKEALIRGFPINTEVSGGCCPAFFKSSFLIDPFGDIYKCPAFLGDKQDAIGNVYAKTLNYFNDMFLMDDSWNDCLDCKFVPICCGGCRYAAKERFGSFLGKKICEKEYLEKVLFEVLKLASDEQIEQLEQAA